MNQFMATQLASSWQLAREQYQYTATATGGALTGRSRAAGQKNTLPGQYELSTGTQKTVG